MDSPSTPDPPRRPPFTPWATCAVRTGLLGLGLAATAAAFTTFEYFHSPYWNRVGLAPDQPVLFSHRHHVGELRLDCRFCHTTVETSADAGMPSTQTCLTCHSQLFRDAPMLRPVRASAERDEPLRWSRVNTLPEHVHFDHSIHVAKGIACASCHGDVATMALTAKAEPLTMRECLACHRDPAPRQVGRSRIFSPRAAATSEPRPALHSQALTSCSTCHH